MFSNFQIIWAQVDPNGHLRHSAYYDLAAQVRVNAFSAHNLNIKDLLRLGVGPILFREEARFYKELVLNEEVRVDLKISKAREDGYKWSIIHTFYKKDDSVAATVTVDGAWMDLQQRKVTVPPKEIVQAFEEFPKTDDFEAL